MTIEEMNAKYGRPTTTSSNSGSIADLWGQPQEPQDSFLKTIIKEPIKQLLVKPAARTAEAVGRTGILGENIQKGYESMADTGQKIGGFNIEPVQNDRQVVGEALQTASYLFPYGKVAGAAGKVVGSKLAGNVISGAAGGYTADVGYGLADNTQTTGEALTPGLGTAIGGAIPLVAPATRVAGRALAKTGEKVVDAVIPASSREAQILQTYKANNPFFKRVSDVLKGTDISPTTAGKTTATKSLFGTKSQIGIQAKRAEEKLWNEVISPRLKESTYAVDLDGFFSKIEDDIITNNPEVSRQKSLLNALNSFKDDYAGTKAISLEKLQKLKEGWAEFVPEKFYKGENIAGNAKQVQALLADEARQTIYSQLGDDVKQAYFDYGNLQGLKKMGVVSMTGQKLKGGTGGFVSELFSQAVTPVGTVGGQAIYKLGKGIEFIGNLGAKNLGEALGIQGGMKFPGDMAVDDISATIKKAKSLPNQQGGFIKIGQDANLPTKTQSSQTASKVNSNVISPKSTTKSLKVKGETTNLISEAKKYKSAEDFANNTPNDILEKLREQGIRGGEQRMKFWEDATGKQAGTSYQMVHRPTEGVSAFNLTEKVNGEQMIPKDMYTNWYGSRGTPADLESIAVLKKIKGKPEANVTIYRASPKESFNNGDWVTFSKKYAQEHAKGNNSKVFSKVVKAKDVKWAMDDVNEFGYFPKSQLTDIWKKAKGK